MYTWPGEHKSDDPNLALFLDQLELEDCRNEMQRGGDVSVEPDKEINLQYGYRMNFLEDFKEKITYEVRHRDNVPRILVDITDMFQVENYIYIDQIAVWITTYKLLHWNEMDEFVRFYLDRMKRVFTGQLLVDPYIEVDTMTIGARIKNVSRPE